MFDDPRLPKFPHEEHLTRCDPLGLTDPLYHLLRIFTGIKKYELHDIWRFRRRKKIFVTLTISYHNLKRLQAMRSTEATHHAQVHGAVERLRPNPPSESGRRDAND
jgi:hypothetical protein